VGCLRRSREERGVELVEPTLGLVESADEQEAADLEIARVRGVDPIAMGFERRPRRLERLRG
jgi:hypothetical protein